MHATYRGKDETPLSGIINTDMGSASKVALGHGVETRVHTAATNGGSNSCNTQRGCYICVETNSRFRRRSVRTRPCLSWTTPPRGCQVGRRDVQHPSTPLRHRFPEPHRCHNATQQSKRNETNDITLSVDPRQTSNAGEFCVLVLLQ